MRKVLIISTLICTFLFLLSCNQGTDESTAGTNTGAATNFTLTSLTQENEISLEDFRGKGVVLNFWATWCGPCREEMPLFEETWKKFKDKDVIFVGVDVMDNKENASEFLDAIGITYPNLYDPSGKVSNKYNVIALPATFFIDKEGNIVSKNYGAFVGKEGKKKLNLYLEEISD